MSGAVRWLGGTLSDVLAAYAQIYFSRRRLPGLLFLLATFVVPGHGASGLVGLVASQAWARLLGRPDEHIREGFYGFNGLLVGLALGLYFRFTPAFVALLVLTSLWTVVLAAVLRNLATRYLGVPVLSLPFVLATWIAILAARRFAGVEWTVDPILATTIGAGFLPTTIELYLRSLGAAFFQLSVLSSLLVFAGLLISSRWATLLSVFGFSAGAAVYVGLGGDWSDMNAQYIGFNFILTAIAVGGVWIVLGPASMLLAAAAGALSALLAAATVAVLAPFNLPILALPFITTTVLLLFCLYINPLSGRLAAVQGVPGSPEANLARAVLRATRYPDPAVPVLLLPVMGRWSVTQGPDGDQTHKGLWSHAWDFEATDDDGRVYRGEGRELADYYAYRAPVVAPGEGRVMRVVNHLEDNPIGEVDTVHNWGNTVIIWHSGDVYTALCHLQKGSITVKEGETVRVGQIVGKIGNSGRSPVPHLHLQLQSSRDIGAPTRYGEFIHFTRQDGEALRYVTHGVPVEGEQVAPVTVSEAVRAAVSLPPGRQWRWSVSQGDQQREEIWSSTIDPLGERRIVTDDGRAELDYFADDHYTTALDYRGPHDLLLASFALGAARIPYLEDAQVVWEDAPSSMHLLGPVARWVSELAMPFGGHSRLETTARLSRQGERVRVETKVAVRSSMVDLRRVPETIEIEFVAGRGPVSLVARRGDTEMLRGEASQ